jgi:hypothetical protein
VVLKNDPAILMILLGFTLLSGCTNNRLPNVLVAEEKMVQDCKYLDTISETSDPGKFVTNYQLVEYYDGELKVLERANNMAATHIVWMYNHPIGSSASAYRCDK